MLKEKFEKLKESFMPKEGENNKRKIENLVIFAIILIVTIVAINYIWNDDNQKSKTITNNDPNKKLAMEENIVSESNLSNTSSSIEEKLENILSNIKGVGEVKVLITYSESSKLIPLYDEDSSSTVTEETDSGGGTRVVNETSTSKEVIYEENDGVKTPMTQSVVNPKIEGAIITATGANNSEVKTNIVQAVEAVTGLATYKIQVFEMK